MAGLTYSVPSGTKIQQMEEKISGDEKIQSGLQRCR
jgi:hypothetical protein